MTDPVRNGEPPPHGKGKPPHLPVGKGHTDEEHRRASRTQGPVDDLPNLPKNARSAHDQLPGGFRKGVPGRLTVVDKDDDA